MTEHPTFAIIGRYLQGEVALEQAAEAIMQSSGGQPGFSISLVDLDPAGRERAESLMARMMWHVLRAQDPTSVPERPFDVGDFRELHEEMKRLGAEPPPEGGT